MKTGGPIRGFLARWVVRIEASGVIMRMVLFGITAASTATSALLSLGVEPPTVGAILTVGTAAAFAFAYGYVETGVFNRKNRESADRGDNYVGVDILINQLIAGRQHAAIWAAALDADPDELRAAADAQTIEAVADLRDGVDDVEALLQEVQND